MTLSKGDLGAYKNSKLVSTHTNPMSFGKNLRMVDRVYQNSDRDTQAFLRKMLLMRMNEAKAMIHSKQYTSGEKSVIRSNNVALENMWERWKMTTEEYES